MHHDRGRKPAYAALLLAAAFVLSGCLQSREATIEPLPAEDQTDLGLGPDVRALSSGPGDKGSPGWSPDGEDITFMMDGYVVEKPAYSEEVGRYTTKDFGAREVEWLSNNSLAILGAAPKTEPGSASGESEAPGSLYRANIGNNSLKVRRMAAGALAMSPGPGGRGLLVALQTGPYKSTLALTVGGVLIPYVGLTIEGRVTDLSVSPDGNQAVLAVRSGEQGPFEIHIFDTTSGTSERLTRLDEKLAVFGAPQWTRHGIYYVVGSEDSRGASDSGFYELYRVTLVSGKPKPAPGVGEEFTASSLQASPDGERLAIIGRLSPNSPTNLYVLDPGGKNLRAITTNEDMEIKIGPDDLDWAPDGESIAIVARGPFSDPLIRDAPADTLLREFPNIYEIPVKAEGDG